mmetsp:Transcript_49917/g.99368  ORF Transcript_49917/g.99368 Transcript_49917/m.99368 type:complete len:173 (+) Transcript_49917:366-884(+)
MEPHIHPGGVSETRWHQVCLTCSALGLLAVWRTHATPAGLGSLTMPASPCTTTHVCSPSPHRYRLLNEQFIELFDTDLVRVPQRRPPWLLPTSSSTSAPPTAAKHGPEPRPSSEPACHHLGHQEAACEHKSAGAPLAVGASAAGYQLPAPLPVPATPAAIESTANQQSSDHS